MQSQPHGTTQNTFLMSASIDDNSLMAQYRNGNMSAFQDNKQQQ